MRTAFRMIAVVCLLAGAAMAQAPYGLLPQPRACFYDQNGDPLAGGQIGTYQAGTSTPLATYSDASGLWPNANPVILDGNGCAAIWLAAAPYKIAVLDGNGAQLYVTDNVANLGATTRNLAVLLAPAARGMQTVLGPLTVDYLQGSTLHFTSPNIRVSLLDPNSTLDTATNAPGLATTTPAAPGQIYTVPDPASAHANFVLNPASDGSNTLDCSQPGITCKRTASAYFEGGACNNTTAAMGWDTFGSNSPAPVCLTGTNVQKGVLALPSAATPIQTATCTGSGAGTCVVAMPKATTVHNFLMVSCAVDGGKTISTVSDGTNAYTKAVSKTNGNTDVEIWYFNGDSASVAAGNLTITLSGAANSACRWREYQDVLTAAMLDQTASNSGTGTAVTTGATIGTAQNVELVLAAVGSPAAPTVAGASGWTEHGAVAQGVNVTVDSAAMIQQATAIQSSTFTLGSSQAWASAIATFKAAVAGPVKAQRGLGLPAFFDATRPANAMVRWQAPSAPAGTVDVSLSAQLACTADGSTDDPAFNAATTATPAVPISAAGVVTTTSLPGLDLTGCAGSRLLHVQLLRNRYSAADTYEGFVYMHGLGLSFGITQ